MKWGKKDQLFETFWYWRRKRRQKKKQNKKIDKDNVIRDTRILFKQEKEGDYYEPKWVCNVWNNSYIDYESNGVKNRNLSLD